MLEHPFFVALNVTYALGRRRARKIGVFPYVECVNAKMELNPHLDDEASLRMRVAEAIVAGGGTSTMSERTGIPVGTLNKYTAMTSTASFTNAAKIALAAGVGLDVIAFGRSPMASQNVSKLSERLRSQARWLNEQTDFVRLPVYPDIRASAGPGAAVPSERVDGVISFDPRFLRDQGAVPERCSVIWAHGDSMVPTIPDGSALIVDHSQTEVKNGSIMVIGVGEDLLVKRVRRRLDGLIDLISDNAAYQPETLGPDALQQLRVIGRVVYFCRTP